MVSYSSALISNILCVLFSGGRWGLWEVPESSVVVFLSLYLQYKFSDMIQSLSGRIMRIWSHVVFRLALPFCVFWLSVFWVILKELVVGVELMEVTLLSVLLTFCLDEVAALPAHESGALLFFLHVIEISINLSGPLQQMGWHPNQDCLSWGHEHHNALRPLGSEPPYYKDT